jgi:hypothetical protein
MIRKSFARSSLCNVRNAAHAWKHHFSVQNSCSLGAGPDEGFLEFWNTHTKHDSPFQKSPLLAHPVRPRPAKQGRFSRGVRQYYSNSRRITKVPKIGRREVAKRMEREACSVSAGWLGSSPRAPSSAVRLMSYVQIFKELSAE